MLLVLACWAPPHPLPLAVLVLLQLDFFPGSSSRMVASVNVGSGQSFVWQAHYAYAVSLIH